MNDIRFRLASRAAFWLLLALVCFLTLGSVQYRPRIGFPALERALAYFVLAVALTLGHPRRPWASIASVVAIAATLEVLQAFAPGRDPRLLDVAEKVIGGLLGWASALLLLRGKVVPEDTRPV